MNYSCVIVAAGSGIRTGLDYNKVFYKINDKLVIEKSLSHFISDPDCKQIIIVINVAEEKFFKDLKLSYKVEFVWGGLRRQDSVYNGLKKVKENFVMIHDGARPYLSFEIIEKVKSSLLSYNACVVMVKSTDTVKIVKDNIVATTLKRKNVYNAQTPQAFKTELIINSYKKIFKENKQITDDAQAVELTSSEEIFVVEGDYRNKKITTEEDLA